MQSSARSPRRKKISAGEQRAHTVVHWRTEESPPPVRSGESPPHCEQTHSCGQTVDPGQLQRPRGSK